jgi:hypothetical protein
VVDRFPARALKSRIAQQANGTSAAERGKRKRRTAACAFLPLTASLVCIASDSAGYTLLLYRTKMGLDDSLAYADALTLLGRGADPNRAAAGGMTFEKMLMDHRAHFGRTPPAEFAMLWDGAERRGILHESK